MSTNPQIRSICVHPEHIGRHTSNTISALHFFATQNNIPLSYDKAPSCFTDSFHPGVTFVHFQLTNDQTIKACYDMADWPQIASTTHLEHCDIYLKRSYLPEEINKLPSSLRAKILPYGLYFPFSPLSLKHELLSYWSAIRSSNARSTSDLKEAALKGIWDTTRYILKNDPPFTPLHKLESIQGGENTILFQVRLWDPKQHIVRALKSNFPTKFVGGITPTPYSEKICPELHTTLSPTPKNYISLLAQSKIVIAEEGLHGTHGAKLGEYFAAGRCILSEPSFYTLPHQPRDGVDYLEFTTPEKCVELVNDLLANPSKIDELISNARNLYKEKLNPVTATTSPIYNFLSANFSNESRDPITS